jgi:hypothetical protein
VSALVVHTVGGPLFVDGSLDVNVRADVHAHRDRPHEKPIEPIVPFEQARDSNGQFIASGTAVTPFGPITWSGTADLQPQQYFPDTPNPLISFGQFDVPQRRLAMALFGAATEGLFVTGPGRPPFALPTTTGLLDGPFAPMLQVPSLQLTIDDAFTIPGGTREEQGANENGDYVLRLTWESIDADHAPDPTEAR